MQTKQIISTNFSKVIKGVEEAILDGYRVVHEGIGSPYHMIMGNFIVNLEKADEKVKDSEEITEGVVLLEVDKIVDVSHTESVVSVKPVPQKPRKVKRSTIS